MKNTAIAMLISLFGFIVVGVGVLTEWLSKWYSLLAFMFFMGLVLSCIHLSIDILISDDDE